MKVSELSILNPQFHKILLNHAKTVVKSENDRLSDTQRLWLHVLSGAGIKTEMCYAIANKEDKGGNGKGGL